MYYPVGWPRILRLPPAASTAGSIDEQEIRQVVCNRDKILTAVLTEDALQIWYIKVLFRDTFFDRAFRDS
jgi:hypothetical protein